VAAELRFEIHIQLDLVSDRESVAAHWAQELNMPDFQIVLRTEAARYTTGDGFVGVLSTGTWSDLFTRLRNRLQADSATADELLAFRDAILAAINSAPEADLDIREKEALRSILLTTFDGVARMYLATVAPKGQFLRNVQF
jgi:hypothetical protein